MRIGCKFSYSSLINEKIGAKFYKYLKDNFDNINAISWNKGCFVGQEITARMKYRALLKKQLYPLEIISGKINIGDKIIEKEVNFEKMYKEKK